MLKLGAVMSLITRMISSDELFLTVAKRGGWSSSLLIWIEAISAVTLDRSALGRPDSLKR